MPDGLTEVPIEAGSRFWSAVASHLTATSDWADRLIIVAGAGDASELRSALIDAAVIRGWGPVRLPRITTLADLGESELAGERARSDSARRIELFAALKQQSWLAPHGRAGSRPLWSMARQLTRLADHLTEGLGAALVDGQGLPHLVEARLLAAAQGTFQAGAWQACSAEAELVLSVWRATLSQDDGAARRLRGLERWAVHHADPIYAINVRLWDAHEQAFLERCAQTRSVILVGCDLARSLALQPALAAAWPELQLMSHQGLRAPRPDAASVHETSERGVDMRTRAQLLSTTSARLSHVTLAACNNLEDEATRAAVRIVQWRATGIERIGIIALERRVARRLRALLERAQILVRDEAGWRLSTTAVAGSLMRWLELASRDAARCDSEVLLDWLKSPFSFAQYDDKPEALALLEIAIRRHKVHRGLDSIESALARERARAGWSSPGDHSGPQSGFHSEAFEHLQNEEIDAIAAGADSGVRVALEILREVRASLSARAARASAAEHFRWLDESLRRSGVTAALAADRGGVQLLEALRRLAHEAEFGSGLRLSYDEWRDYVGDALENDTFRDDSIDSPIAIVDFREAVLRPFDALIVLGADASHFPLRSDAGLFFSASVSRQLGLADPASEPSGQLRELALLLAPVRPVQISWQAEVSGEQRAPAAALERLARVHEAAFGDDLRHPWEALAFEEPRMPVYRPAPRAADLMPTRMSVSEVTSLVRCPYQYFVHSMLGIRALDDLSEEVGQREYGQLVHRILERFHGEEGVDEVDSNRGGLLARLAEVSSRVIRAEVGENPAYFGYRERWLGVMPAYVDWLLDWRARGGRFVAAEEAAEVELPIDGGSPLALRGRLDRLERIGVAEIIIDYKARARDALRALLRRPGEDVQLALYSVLRGADESTRAFYLSVDRDSVAEVGPPAPLAPLARDVRERLIADVAQIRGGAPLPALGSEASCKYCDARGVCRKGQWQAEPGGGPT